MLSRRFRIRPSLEQLEDRTVPATAIVANGLLLVSNPVVSAGKASLTITAVNNNQFQVKDGNSIVGTYSAGTGVYITGSNSADSITFDLNGKSFTGNLLINTMNGNDTTNIAGKLTGGGTGTIGGNVTIVMGSGNDSINLNTAANSKLTIGGEVSATSSVFAQSTFRMGNADSITTIGRTMNLVGFANNGATPAVQIGGGAGAAQYVLPTPGVAGPGFEHDSIGGQLSINSVLANSPVTVNIGKVIPGRESGPDALAIGVTLGSLNVTTGNGNDAVNLLGAAQRDNLASFGTPRAPVRTPGVGTVINGNAQVQLGNGNNYFGSVGARFTASEAGGQETTINGNLNYQAGSGNDSFELGGYGIGSGVGTFIGGSAILNLGDGDNNFGDDSTGGGTGSNFGLSATESVIFGDLNVTLGNGNNIANFVAVQVQGNMTWNLGNGNNGTPAMPIRFRQPPKGLFTFRTGNGNNYLQLITSRVNGSPYIFNVNIQFGNGDDTFEVGGMVPAALAGSPNNRDQGGFLTGRVDGGGALTGDVFIHNTDPALIAPAPVGGEPWELLAPFTLSNFP